MKTENGVSKSWDDLVFENKNKEYGAYSVRKSYSQNLTTGFGVSVCLACMLIILPKIMSALFPGQTIVPDITDAGKEIITTFTQPPLVEPPKVTPPPQAPRAQTNFPPAVTSREVETVIPTNDEIEESLSNTEPGEGVVPGPSEPAIVETAPPPVEPTEYTNAQVMPAYNGGLQAMYRFISRNIKYPRVAQRNGVEGTVFVTFVVSKDGSVTSVSIAKGISEECDKEALRVISLLDKWTPGQQNQRAVNVRMTIPIKFDLAE
jgi:periplasmic protein TonB